MPDEEDDPPTVEEAIEAAANGAEADDCGVEPAIEPAVGGLEIKAFGWDPASEAEPGETTTVEAVNECGCLKCPDKPCYPCWRNWGRCIGNPDDKCPGGVSPRTKWSGINWSGNTIPMAGTGHDADLYALFPPLIAGDEEPFFLFSDTYAYRGDCESNTPVFSVTYIVRFVCNSAVVDEETGELLTTIRYDVLRKQIDCDCVEPCATTTRMLASGTLPRGFYDCGNWMLLEWTYEEYEPAVPDEDVNLWPPGTPVRLYVCGNFSTTYTDTEVIYECIDGYPDPSEQWWITKDKLIVRADNAPPVDWLGGPHPSEAIAEYWRDQIGPAVRCVTWQDHEGDPAETPALPPPLSEVDRADLPATVGPEYVECLSDTEIAAKLAGAVELVVTDHLGVTRTEFWGAAPRYPDPWPFETITREEAGESPVLRRRCVIGKTETGQEATKGWYSELTEYHTFDNGPGADPRFVYEATEANKIPWYGYEERRTGHEKCRQNCPPCHRRRKCTVIDPLTGMAAVVDMVEDAGTDWRPDLPAVLADESGMYTWAALCNWICANACNQFRFALLCDPAHPEYLGCADRFEVAAALVASAELYGARIPASVVASARDVMRANRPATPRKRPLFRAPGAARPRSGPVEVPATAPGAGTDPTPARPRLTPNEVAARGYPCRHRGTETGKTEVHDACCGASVRVPLVTCARFGVCTLRMFVEDDNGPVACCVTCKAREPLDATGVDC